MDDVDESIENAVESLLMNRMWVPMNPFRAIISYYKRQEYSSEIRTTLKRFPSLGPNSLVPHNVHSLDIANLAGTNRAGLKHIAKLVSKEAIDFSFMLKSKILSVLRTHPSSSADESLPMLHQSSSILDSNSQSQSITLGSVLQETTPEAKTPVLSIGKFRCIEVVHVSNCHSIEVSHSHRQSIKLTAEGISHSVSIEASIDVMINTILWELSNSNSSADIIYPRITIKHSNVAKKSKTATETDRSPRRLSPQYVMHNPIETISILKTAFVNEGNVFLEFIYRMDIDNENLQRFHHHAMSVSSTIPEVTFIRVSRLYKLTHISDRRDRVVCLASAPFESLGCGVFATLSDTICYRRLFCVCLVQPEKLSSEFVDQLMNSPTEFSSSYHEEANVKPLSITCDVAVPRTLLELHTVKVTKTLADSYFEFLHGSIAKSAVDFISLISLLSSDSVNFYYCALQLTAMATGSNALVHDIAELTIVTTHTVEWLIHVLLESASNQGQVTKHKLKGITEGVLSCVNLIKQVVTALQSNQHQSDIQSTCICIFDSVDRLLQHSALTKVAMNAFIAAEDPQTVRSLTSALSLTYQSLSEVGAILEIIERSSSSHKLTALLQLQLSQTTVSVDSLINIASTAAALSKPRDYSEVPRNLLDLLGYLKGLNSGRVQWTTYTLPVAYKHFIIRNRFVNADSAMSDSIDNSLKEKGADVFSLYVLVHREFPSLMPIVSLAELARTEYFNRESPRFMPLEGAILRYLHESLVMTAFNEAKFQLSTTITENASMHAIIIDTLNQYAVRAEMVSREMSDEAILTQSLANIRNDALRSFVVDDLKTLSGYACVPLRRPDGEELCRLCGLDRFLACSQPIDVVRLCLSMPPILPGTNEACDHLPSQILCIPEDCRVEILGGLSAQNVLSLSIPCIDRQGTAGLKVSRSAMRISTLEVEVVVSAAISESCPTSSVHSRSYQLRLSSIRSYFSKIVEMTCKHLNDHPDWFPEQLCLHHSEILDDSLNEYAIVDVIKSSDILEAVNTVVGSTGVAIVKGFVALPVVTNDDVLKMIFSQGGGKEDWSAYFSSQWMLSSHSTGQLIRKMINDPYSENERAKFLCPMTIRFTLVCSDQCRAIPPFVSSSDLKTASWTFFSKKVVIPVCCDDSHPIDCDDPFNSSQLLNKVAQYRIGRLAASTVWLSAHAARAVLSIYSQFGVAASLLLEMNQWFDIYERHLMTHRERSRHRLMFDVNRVDLPMNHLVPHIRASSRRSSEANSIEIDAIATQRRSACIPIEAALLLTVVTREYSTLCALIRCFNSTMMLWADISRHIAHCFALIAWIERASSDPFSRKKVVCAKRIIVLTVAEKICLQSRKALFAGASVHSVPGYATLLRKLEELERLLQIEPISVDASLGDETPNLNSNPEAREASVSMERAVDSNTPGGSDSIARQSVPAEMQSLLDLTILSSLSVLLSSVDHLVAAYSDMALQCLLNIHPSIVQLSLNAPQGLTDQSSSLWESIVDQRVERIWDDLAERFRLIIVQSVCDERVLDIKVVRGAEEIRRGIEMQRIFAAAPLNKIFDHLSYLIALNQSTRLAEGTSFRDICKYLARVINLEDSDADRVNVDQFNLAKPFQPSKDRYAYSTPRMELVCESSETRYVSAPQDMSIFPASIPIGHEIEASLESSERKSDMIVSDRPTLESSLMAATNINDDSNDFEEGVSSLTLIESDAPDEGILCSLNPLAVVNRSLETSTLDETAIAEAPIKDDEALSSAARQTPRSNQDSGGSIQHHVNQSWRRFETSILRHAVLAKDRLESTESPGTVLEQRDTSAAQTTSIPSSDDSSIIDEMSIEPPLQDESQSFNLMTTNRKVSRDNSGASIYRHRPRVGADEGIVIASFAKRSIAVGANDHREHRSDRLIGRDSFGSAFEANRSENLLRRHAAAAWGDSHSIGVDVWGPRRHIHDDEVDEVTATEPSSTYEIRGRYRSGEIVHDDKYMSNTILSIDDTYDRFAEDQDDRFRAFSRDMSVARNTFLDDD